MKNRKQPTYKVYISTVCMFCKILNLILFIRHNALLGCLYVVFCILHLVFLPEPAYSGPDKVTYFKGDALEDEIKRDPRVTWLVCFYAAWSPNCVNFAPVFAELSGKYTLDNLKFGKLDVTRYPETADKFRVDTSSWTKQLPTVMLFQGGKLSERRPMVDANGRLLVKFVFSRENVMTQFNLNEVFLQCKKNPIKKRKGKQDLEKKTVASNGDAKDKTE